jgi:hypothetical protein
LNLCRSPDAERPFEKHTKQQAYYSFGYFNFYGGWKASRKNDAAHKSFKFLIRTQYPKF